MKKKLVILFLVLIPISISVYLLAGEEKKVLRSRENNYLQVDSKVIAESNLRITGMTCPT